MLGQLLAPVAKVALQDPRLFARDSHPVRRLLNMLAEACDGNPGGTAAELAVLAQVQSVAARVVQDFDEHLGVFLQAESEFGAYYEQYRRRVEIAERRAAELQRAEERRVGAQALLAAAAIEVRLRGGRCRRCWRDSCAGRGRSTSSGPRCAKVVPRGQPWRPPSFYRRPARRGGAGGSRRRLAGPPAPGPAADLRRGRARPRIGGGRRRCVAGRAQRRAGGGCAGAGAAACTAAAGPGRRGCGLAAARGVAGPAGVRHRHGRVLPGPAAGHLAGFRRPPGGSSRESWPGSVRSPAGACS